MGASNLHYHQWERHVAIADELVGFGTAGVAPKTYPVLAPPRIQTNPNFLDTGETGRGRSEKHRDQFAFGSKESGSTFESRAGSVFLYKMLVGLLQMKPAGVESPASSGHFKHTFTIYDEQPSVNYGFTMWDAWRAGATDHGRRSIGNIPRVLGLRSEENAIVRMPVETIALNAERQTLAAPVAAWSSPLLWTHRHLITAEIDTVAIGPAALDLSLSNNAVPWYGGSQTPTEIVLGMFGITGSFTISLRGQGADELQNFLDKNSVVLKFGYGSVVDESGYTDMEFDATYSGADDVDRNGIQAMALPFESALKETGSTTTTINVWHSADLSV